MSKRTDLAGQTFGQLTVIGDGGTNSRRESVWLCKCTCGNTTQVTTSKLRSGNTSSCGCLHRETVAQQMTKHGQHNTDLYRRWQAMKTRTTNPNHDFYDRYGGRGITVCERWKDFANFQADMGPTFDKELLLERIDNDGPYSPANCRWATRQEQARNTRRTVFVEFRGHKRSLPDWCELLGLNYNTAKRRLLDGWSAERALTTGVLPERLADLPEPGGERWTR